MTDAVLLFPRTGTMDIKGVLVEIPQSLLFIAAFLEKAKLSTKIIDQRVEKDWKTALRREAKNTKLVGISAMTGKQIDYGLKAAKVVRESSDAKIVWGGIHPSLMPEQTIRNDLVDAVVVGEGEETLVEMLKEKDWSKVKGIVFKKGGKTISTKPRDFLDINKLPPPPYHLLKMENYFIPFVGARALHVHTSRGCPHRCTFCYNRVFNQGRWRAMKAKKAADMIEEMVKRFDLDGVVFTEDNFFVDLKRVEDIFKELDRRSVKIRWKGDCRIDYLDRMSESFLSFLEEHGLDTLNIGVESGSQRVLKRIQKDITVEQIYRVNKKLAKTNITPRYSFMMGFPDETEEDRRATMGMIVRIIEDNKKAMIGNVSLFSPYPGCEMFKEAIERGFSPPGSLEGWADLDLTTIDMPFIDKKLRKRLENISHMSRFVDGISVSRYLKTRPLIRALALVYSRIVRYRWKRGFFSFMPELAIFKILYKRGMIR